MYAALNMSAPGAHNVQSLTTLQLRVESSRETVHVCLPRESTSRFVARVHLYLENRSRVYLENNREDRPERGRESHQKLLSHRKARVVITE